MNGFLLIKSETSLNISGFTTDNELIKKCCNKKISKNKADNAIVNFFPIDDRSRDSLAIKQFLICKETNVEKLKNFNNEKSHSIGLRRQFRMILNKYLLKFRSSNLKLIP